MNVCLKDISDNVAAYRSQIELLLDRLDTEKEFFRLTIERVMKCELVLIATENDQVIGVGALERKYGVSRSLIIVDKRYHGKGLGRSCIRELLSIAKAHRYSLIMAVVEELNTRALKFHLAAGYRFVGKRENLYYIFYPLSLKGILYFHISRFLFPLTAVVDYIRR